VTVKAFVLLQLFINQRILIFFTIYSKIFSTLIIRKVSCAANHHIRMISEGSCNTEDWSNNAENSEE